MESNVGNNAAVLKTWVCHHRIRGVGMAGRRGRDRPRTVETPGARVSFRPHNIFPHFCMLFLKLPLFVVMLPTYN